MKGSAVVTRELGLFSTLGYPQSVLHVNRFLATSGLADSAVARSLRTATPELARSHMGGKDWAKKLKEFFFGHPIRVIGTAEADIPIAIHELHCPRVANAEASLVLSSTSTETDSCDVTILGIGGGDKFTLKHQATDEFTVKETCQAFVYSYKGFWDLCEVDDEDGGTHRFPRLRDVASEYDKVLSQTIANDGCFDVAIEYGTAPERTEIDLRSATAITHKKTLKVVSELKLKGSSKVKLETFGIEVGADFEAEKSFENQLNYSLPGGRRYLTFRPDNSWSWLWRI